MNKMKKNIEKNVHIPCKIKIKKENKNKYEIKINDKQTFSIYWDEKARRDLKRNHRITIDEEAARIVSMEINQYLEGRKNGR